MANERGLVRRGDRWGFDFMHNGQRHTSTIGSKSDALNALRVERAKLLDERMQRDYGIRRRGRQVLTVQQFHDNEYRPWLDNNRAEWTRKNDAHVFRRFCAAYGMKPLDAPNWPATIEQYKTARYEAGIIRASVGYELRRLSGFFTLAVERRHLRENPMDRVEVPRSDQREYRLLEPEEEKCFFAALPNPMARAMFRVTFWAGLRRGEALNLRVGQVDFNNAEIRIVQQKTGWTKVLHLVAPAVALLKEIIPAGAAPDARVFHQANGKPMTRNTWEDCFEVARRHCKLTGLRPHDLRHTIGTRLAEQGAPLAVIGQALGHKPPYRSTLIYIQHAKSSTVKKALEHLFERQK